MEEQVVHWLTETQSAHEAPRRNAELQLKQSYNNPDFPLALVSIGTHAHVPLDVRQSALLYLKIWVLACWSPQLDEFAGQLYTDHDKKLHIRQSLLDLAVSGSDERKIKSAASLVVSKIASADFPDDWPDLLPTILNVIAAGNDAQLHGALKVLSELVDDCFNDEQFFNVARNLVRNVYDVAVNDTRKPTLRALAISVFCSCFDTMEMVMEDHKADVKSFAEEALAGWIPFFITTLKTPLPPAPSPDDDNHATSTAETYRGYVALKLQVVKVLMRIRSVFPSVLAPQSPALFSAIWQELLTLREQYHALYIEDDRQGRLEDADGLPYTLDFLVIEELDFLQACLRAPPVRKELEQQIQTHGSSAEWMSEIMDIAVSYAQITTEEEGLWDIDVNIFLSEETNVTANYTPRTACGDLVIKLGDWLSAATVEGLLAYTRNLYSGNGSWKAKEASLYLLNQLLGEFQDVEKKIGAEAADGYVDFIQRAMQEEAVFLRARGYLVAGGLIRTSGDTLGQVAATFMQTSLQAITHDPSEIVRVSCIRALQSYLAALPSALSLPHQASIIAAVSHFLDAQDFGDLTDSDDLLITIIETLRDAIMLDTSTCLTNGGIDLLFTVASRGASNFQIALLVTETFEEISNTIAATGKESYAELTAKVLPSLTGAFDVATLTEENALANLAAELLSVLSANGSTPLPPKFVVTVMPRLSRLLMESNDDELLKSATSALQNMLNHDPEQVFAFQDHNGKGGLEVVLIVIDRLLNPSVDDNGAAEVGGLAAELVEKAGSARMGPYLMQLLRAVAIRLASASQAHLIQSLILVFARLAVISAQEVVGFLADVRIGSQSGLEVVMSKWLENSINFAGYDDIRQNVVALANLYNLNDARISSIQVKGDLIVPKSDRIMTRSRARQAPDQYTVVSAQLKIVKVLVEELLSASGNRAIDPADAVDLDNDDEDCEWEDDPNDFLDLGAGMTKSQLMAFGAEDSNTFSRGRDDETQAYLVGFFRQAAQKPEFGDAFNSLTPEEQEKLRNMSDP
ncbi:armadillo-type protein [Neohortaea acidophila]|uniref:Armadillo-type protein n=1 Tax=Neohortaea acidophila TaxID=245834 RepID=A0A6A6PUU9_9PEZI|nr:armadillo-type protein [Neohortaea acidophila]KAF2483017.1 armadillo-type protein [Neohortaea acidophila]